VAVLYLLGSFTENSQAVEELNKAYAELKRLYELNPNPGKPKGSDKTNIQTAREQQDQLRRQLALDRGLFVRIPAIPDTPRVSADEFTAQLRRTIDWLQREARVRGVSVPTNYNFTFESIVRKVTFRTDSLQALAVQLGEVKTITELLLRSKVNALENMRREVVCREDEPSNAPSDYLEQKSVTNQHAVLKPYEVTFRCFSKELADVLSDFGASSNSILVKSINVEPAPAMASDLGPGPEAPVPTYFPQPLVPSGTSTMAAERFRSRYGFGPGSRYSPAMPPPMQPTPVPMVVPGTPVRTGPQTVITERAFKVVIMVHVVKLLPPK
jgi:hypothetical protein